MESFDVTDLADLRTILSHEGKINGVVNSCNIDEFISSLDERIKESLIKAKGILINFGIHSEQSLFKINDLMVEINDLVNEEAEIIFSSEQIDGIDQNKVFYKIIITGL